MEALLQEICGQHIRLNKYRKYRNNKHLRKFLGRLMKLLKQDPTFDELYDDTFYGGSFYDNLKIKAPDEFDIDILFKLPNNVHADLRRSNRPGYVEVNLSNTDCILDQFVDESDYLSTVKLKEWFTDLVIKTVNGLNCTVERVPKNSPAVTLAIMYGKRKQYKFDVDLVPCFNFDSTDWPQGGYREEPFSLGAGFFIVPKSINTDEFGRPERYWRLSFQKQEREILKDEFFLKPCIKMMKFLRDKEGHTLIKSYFIKTVALWALFDDPECFFGKSMTDSLIVLLQIFIEWLRASEDRVLNTECTRSYYWNEKLDLFEDTSSEFFENVGNRLSKLIDYLQREDVERVRDFFGI